MPFEAPGSQISLGYFFPIFEESLKADIGEWMFEQLGDHAEAH